MFFVAKNHAGASAVYVLDNRGDFRVALAERFDEIIPGRKNGRGRYQNDHDLVCLKSSLYQDVAQQAVARVLVVHGYLKGTEHIPDGKNNLIGFLVLDQTGIDGDNLMGAFPVNARNRIVPAVPVENGVNLIPIMKRMLHAGNGMHLAEAGEKRGDFPLLFL